MIRLLWLDSSAGLSMGIASSEMSDSLFSVAGDRRPDRHPGGSPAPLSCPLGCRAQEECGCARVLQPSHHSLLSAGEIKLREVLVRPGHKVLILVVIELVNRGRAPLSRVVRAEAASDATGGHPGAEGVPPPGGDLKHELIRRGRAGISVGMAGNE